MTADQGARDEEFTAFVMAYGRRLLHLAELLTSDPALAEDLAQTALSRTYAAWHRIDGDPRAYAHATMLNAQRDWWRRRPWRERPWPEAPVQVATGEDFPADQARRALVLDALRRLSANERAVVALRYYLDLSEIQTAQQLRMPTGTVKSTLARALGKLRADPTLKRGATAEETT